MDIPVIIAGAGPTGLMLACELGLAGIRTVVVERRAEPRVDAPGMAINAGTIELLDQRGLADPLREGTMTLPSVQFSFLPLEPGQLGERQEDTILVLQERLEQVLAHRAAELGVVIRRDREVVGLDQDAAGVTVGLRSRDGYESLRARYVVGCDGRDSAVRRLADIPFPGTDPVFHGLVGDVEVNFANLLPQQIGAHRCPSGGHYAGAPLRPGLLRVITAEFDTAPPDTDAPTLAELRASVRRLTGTELRADGVRWLSRYGNPTRNAVRYRDGRVFLAGDAAHIYFPQNGLGIGTGVHDAVNLGWKLAAVLTGRAGDDLLDTYHRERHPVGAEACLVVQAQIELCHPPERVTALREVVGRVIRFDDVNRYLVATVTGTGVRYPMPGSADHPLLGRRLRTVPLVTQAGSTSVARLLRSGRGVLLRLSGAAVEPEGWKSRIDVVDAAAVPEIDATAVLLRPDGHVAWVATGGTDEGPHAALAAWWGEPDD